MGSPSCLIREGIKDSKGRRSKSEGKPNSCGFLLISQRQCAFQEFFNVIFSVGILATLKAKPGKRRFCSYSSYFESFDFEVKSLTLGGLIVIGSCLSGLFTGKIDDDFSGRMPGSVARNGIKQLVQGEDMGNRGTHLASGYKLRGLGQSRGGRLRPGE